MKVVLLLACIVGAWSLCAVGTLPQPLTWAAAKCLPSKMKSQGMSHGTKLQWCIPSSTVATAIAFQSRVFIKDDCTDDPCLLEVATKCKYTYDAEKGWDLAQLRGDCPFMDDVCRTAINNGLDGTLVGKVCTDPNTEAYLKSWKQKCQVKTTCRDSTFGCCPDGKTEAKGNFNKGCCQYTTAGTVNEVLGGACSILNPATNANFCGWELPTDECNNGVVGDAKNADMMTNPATGTSFKCYCDKVCDITKDCCDGLSENYCAAQGFLISPAPRLPRDGN